MAAITLVDFEDIYTAIIELLKIQSSDTVTLARIKRDINIAYEDVIARHNWWWSRSLTTLQTPVKVSTGTLSVTADSLTITFSSAPTVSVANYKIKIQGRDEVYTVATHTASSTSATLNVGYTGSTDTGLTFTCWKDFVQLPTDCKETFLVQHQLYNQPLIPVGLSDFRRLVAQQPDREGPPVYYTTDDYDSDGKRRLRYWPAVYSSKINMDVDYIMAISPLDLAGDEPAMPIHDRTVLFYYGASHAWERERNPESAAKYFQLGEKKLAEMASKIEDSRETPMLKPSSGYLAQKRRQKRNRTVF